MNYAECTEIFSLNYDVIDHNTFKGKKINYFVIIPEMEQPGELIKQTLIDELLLDYPKKIYPDKNLCIYIVFDLQLPFTKNSQFEFEKAEHVLENLDDNSW